MNKSTITGAKSVAAALRQITPGLAVPINAASRKALRPTLAAAKRHLKANGNIESGQLLKAMTVKKKGGKTTQIHEHLVGPSADNPHYRLGHLVEFGTAPHRIGKKLHPGARAFPFMRPAFDETKDKVIAIFGQELGPAIEKRARQLAAKAAKR